MRFALMKMRVQGKFTYLWFVQDILKFVLLMGRHSS